MFVVADKNMEFAVKGFFGRGDFHHKLQCSHFVFDPRDDVYVARGKNDPGLYVHGDQVFRHACDTHRNIVVMIDEEWEGSPGREEISQRLNGHLTNAGWNGDNSKVLVFEPELENWVWIPHDHVARSLGWDRYEDMRGFVNDAGFWGEGSKPSRPKEALEACLRHIREPRSSKFYERILSGVPGVRHCTDTAFIQLHEALCNWYPRVPA